MAMWQGRKCKMNLLHPQPFRRETGPHIPSVTEYHPVLPQQMRPRYEGDMALREQKAQEEIARKKKSVAPMHKSNYVYVTEGMNPAGLGRKNEVL